MSTTATIIRIVFYLTTGMVVAKHVYKIIHIRYTHMDGSRAKKLMEKDVHMSSESQCGI